MVGAECHLCLYSSLSRRTMQPQPAQKVGGMRVKSSPNHFTPLRSEHEQQNESKELSPQEEREQKEEAKALRQQQIHQMKGETASMDAHNPKGNPHQFGRSSNINPATQQRSFNH
ncbi:hypothetical protein VTP01DRAFT_6022 [Rhizomucor pusillus]|uniref:uncharacterized protein n=1 Tax=Rhizomucor pusillus TaxID=4840 RepID=UPI0037442651